ncbi:Putative outer membrane protein, chaperone Skp (OmpH) family [Oleispira antarctica RB-8]|uniref:Putative outer membrane protein, chaperone Skp (OmpH) family n=1 Tax=Oleispira antarctica RB-8 TaxID=698738 RepID=R4YKR6_OLEAN|nr:Putative outer membrane protein, chaperone Skp (OmpH) family [Oleispira antarctica RB-8]|tara:strand:+ start:2202 stop:2693 length:492 start_codon:yes stop_codon:yes gene_type:complete
MRFLQIALLAMAASFAQAEMKIAVVDMQRAVLASDEAKIAVEKFRAAKQDDIDTISKLETELKGIQDKIAKDGEIMSEDERRKLKNSFEEKATTYKFHRQNMQKAEQQELQQLAQAMEPKMQKALKTIIDENKYDLVVRPEMVIFNGPGTDITKLLLEQLNKK